MVKVHNFTPFTSNYQANLKFFLSLMVLEIYARQLKPIDEVRLDQVISSLASS